MKLSQNAPVRGVSQIARVAEEFETLLSKTAAKEKTSRKKLDKDLAKAKSEYARVKSIQDDLEGKKADIDSKLEKSRAECGAARKKMLKMHKVVQNMDISNASDAILYDTSDDVGYIIQGKEFYLSFNDEGDIEKTPMLQWRKERKAKQNESLPEAEELAEEEEIESSDDEEEKVDEGDVAFSDDEISDIYSFLAD